MFRRVRESDESVVAMLGGLQHHAVLPLTTLFHPARDTMPAPECRAVFSEWFGAVHRTPKVLRVSIEDRSVILYRDACVRAESLSAADPMDAGSADEKNNGRDARGHDAYGDA